MLRNISLENIGLSNKHSQSMLRHKVRNLRAKVKCLLPVDICRKYNKRNRKIRQNQQKRTCIQACRQITTNHEWRKSQQIPERWFYQANNNRERTHMFSKLSTEQIQQINEDRIYYLGTDHVQAFEQFLHQKKYIRGISKTADGSRDTKQFDVEHFRQRRLHRKSTQSKATQNLTNLVDSVNNWFEQIRERNQMNKFNKECRLEAFQEKRKQILEENRTKTVMNKEVVEQKQFKAGINLSEANNIKFEKIKYMNKIDSVKRKNALKVKSQKENRGQIVDLTERLRRICLSKGKDQKQNC